MDGTAILIAAVQMLGTAFCVLVPGAVMYGRLTERVKQIEQRLDGNGVSLPGRCYVHSTKMDDIERRLGHLET